VSRTLPARSSGRFVAPARAKLRNGGNSSDVDRRHRLLRRASLYVEPIRVRGLEPRAFELVAAPNVARSSSIPR
jgi:hypothetical protein